MSVQKVGCPNPWCRGTAFTSGAVWECICCTQGHTFERVPGDEWARVVTVGQDAPPYVGSIAYLTRCPSCDGSFYLDGAVGHGACCENGHGWRLVGPDTIAPLPYNPNEESEVSYLGRIGELGDPADFVRADPSGPGRRVHRTSYSEVDAAWKMIHGLEQLNLARGLRPWGIVPDPGDGPRDFVSIMREIIRLATLGLPVDAADE